MDRTHLDIPPPPFDERTEEAFLGTVLVFPERSEVVAAVREGVPEWFHRREYREIFVAMQKVVAAGGVLDIVSVLTEWERSGSKRADAYLLSGLTGLPSPVGLSASVTKRLEDFRLRRAAWESAMETFETLRRSTATGEELLSALEDRLSAATKGTRRTEAWLEPGNLEEETKSFLRRRWSGAEELTLGTGFSSMDRMLVEGFVGGRVSILAGRPSIGKSTMRVHLTSTWLEAGRGVYLWSPEQQVERDLMAYLAWLSGVEPRRIAFPNRHAENWQEWKEPLKRAAAHWAVNWSLVIRDEGGLTLQELLDDVRRARDSLSHPIDVLVLDMVNHLEDAIAGPLDRKRGALERVLRRQQDFAEREKMHVLNVWHLSREVDRRRGHRPVLSDLRESGAAEEAVDLVFLLHRESYYDPEAGDPTTELILAKQRTVGGSTGLVRLRRVGDVRFEEVGDFDGGFDLGG